MPRPRKPSRKIHPFTDEELQRVRAMLMYVADEFEQARTRTAEAERLAEGSQGNGASTYWGNAAKSLTHLIQRAGMSFDRERFEIYTTISAAMPRNIIHNKTEA